MLWWMKSAGLPPLVTTDTALGAAAAGSLDSPTARVLFGGNQSYGSLNGLRLTLGTWLQSDVGVEASGFLFARRSIGVAAASDTAGNPPLYFPVFRVGRGREGSFAVSDPVLGSAGNIGIVTRSQLWGSEGNFVFNFTQPDQRWHLALLAGFRYLDLREGVYTSTNTSIIGTDIADSINESFTSRSQFYGGQIGTRLGMQWNRLSLDVTAKVALGATHQVVDVQGSDTQTGTGVVNGTFHEGIFAQTSNIGRRTANDFGVIPQVQMKLGYEIRPWMRATFAYDFLYWNRVVRAGEQIDREVDFSQSVVFGTGTPAALPSPLVNRSDFWAQGVSFGIEFRY